MPLHRLFHPPGVFSAEDKKAISERITAVYTAAGLPKFYVVVIFIAVEEDSFYVGGEPTKTFVRIVTQQLARQLVTAERKTQRLQALENAWAPYIKERGLTWEMHVEENDRELWHENGLSPPFPHTEAEKKWAELNKAVPY